MNTIDGLIWGFLVGAIPAIIAGYAILAQRWQNYISVMLITWGLAHLFFWAWADGRFGAVQAVTIYCMVQCVFGLGLAGAINVLPGLLDRLHQQPAPRRRRQ